MALEGVPTDVIGDDLIRTYQRAARELEELVRDALARGLNPDRLGTAGQVAGDATAAYRRRQLAKARAILRDLERFGPRVAPVVARQAYASTLFAVDRVTLADVGRLSSRFGDVHQRAVAAMAANMSSSLEQAARQAGENVAAVFARMDALEGGIAPEAFPFVGRRLDDPWRRVALDTLGEGLVTGATRREATAALYRNLLQEGVGDALTGFVDRRGARWSLETYAEMVARTTTREATSRATVNRLEEHGLDLVTISSHPHAADICTPYDGKTFSLSGGHPRYGKLDRLPPFHPRCRHVVTPGGASLEDFERELGIAAEQRVDVADLEDPPFVPEFGPPPATSTTARIDELLDASGPVAERRLAGAADRIAEVHRVPDDLPRIPFAERARPAGTQAMGAYERSIAGDAVRIEVQASAPEETIIHELGHFLDHRALGSNPTVMASEVDASFDEFLTAVEATSPIKNLREAQATNRIRLSNGQLAELGPSAKGLIEYNLRNREIFARAYEQWIARRTGLTSHRHRAGAGIEYWPDDEFDAIDAALERLFRRKGLIR